MQWAFAAVQGKCCMQSMQCALLLCKAKLYATSAIWLADQGKVLGMFQAAPSNLQGTEAAQHESCHAQLLTTLVSVTAKQQRLH